LENLNLSKPELRSLVLVSLIEFVTSALGFFCTADLAADVATEEDARPDDLFLF
jgi:hypothetical protein